MQIYTFIYSNWINLLFIYIQIHNLHHFPYTEYIFLNFSFIR